MSVYLKKALTLWDSARPLIAEGYRILDKTLVMGLPATSMPAIDKDHNTGIGSPYGTGAQRIWHFWQDVVQKVMIGPVGKTETATWHSPYLSLWQYNPFFIDLEQLVRQKKLSAATLNKIYSHRKKDAYINFKQAEKDYMLALKEAYQKAKSTLPFAKFCNQLVQEQMQSSPFAYIGEIPINIPKNISNIHPHWFLKDWSMGAPPDLYSPEPQMWGFPILNPTKLFKPNQTRIPPIQKTLRRLLRFYLSGCKAGVRIDHFIGWIDPYCFYQGERNYPNGRLHSSAHISPLQKYTFQKDEDFLRLTQEYLTPLFDEFHLSNMDIYPEDLGVRPPQMDFVLQTLNWGKMIPVQFNEPDNDAHMYHGTNASNKDIIVLSTHDNPALFNFFQEIPDSKKSLFAEQLARDLRFQFNEDLCTPERLYRMQWAAALASPAHRVTAFFTSMTGQEGRYNIPGTLDSWHLRCQSDFELGYFQALQKRQAYNPFEAIRWAIYARGDAFFQAHTSLVHKLMETENHLFQALQNL